MHSYHDDSDGACQSLSIVTNVVTVTVLGGVVVLFWNPDHINGINVIWNLGPGPGSCDITVLGMIS